MLRQQAVRQKNPMERALRRQITRGTQRLLKMQILDSLMIVMIPRTCLDFKVLQQIENRERVPTTNRMMDVISRAPEDLNRMGRYFPKKVWELKYLQNPKSDRAIRITSNRAMQRQAITSGIRNTSKITRMDIIPARTDDFTMISSYQIARLREVLIQDPVFTLLPITWQMPRASSTTSPEEEYGHLGKQELVWHLRKQPLFLGHDVTQTDWSELGKGMQRYLQGCLQDL